LFERILELIFSLVACVLESAAAFLVLWGCIYIAREVDPNTAVPPLWFLGALPLAVVVLLHIKEWMDDNALEGYPMLPGFVLGIHAGLSLFAGMVATVPVFMLGVHASFLALWAAVSAILFLASWIWMLRTGNYYWYVRAD
jgi:hypothetical protein